MNWKKFAVVEWRDVNFITKCFCFIDLKFSPNTFKGRWAGHILGGGKDRLLKAKRNSCCFSSVEVLKALRYSREPLGTSTFKWALDMIFTPSDTEDYCVLVRGSSAFELTALLPNHRNWMLSCHLPVPAWARMMLNCCVLSEGNQPFFHVNS